MAGTSSKHSRKSFSFFLNRRYREDVKNYLLTVNNDIISKTEEQDAVWSELDELNVEYVTVQDLGGKPNLPPQASDFATWFDTNNSVDLRTFMRDIEIVFIEAALERNNGNTSEAAKDLKLLRTTLIEKIRNTVSSLLLLLPSLYEIF